PLALKAIGSVSLKANEPGLRQLAHRCRVPFETFGCRRDTPCALLSTLLDRQLAAQRLDPLALKAIGSVSLKANEPGLRQLAHRCRVPFETF
ncbi:cobalamin biosynthesis protein CbiG, partial [Klebsiella pneumoniae]